MNGKHIALITVNNSSSAGKLAQLKVQFCCFCPFKLFKWSLNLKLFMVIGVVDGSIKYNKLKSTWKKTAGFFFSSPARSGWTDLTSVFFNLDRGIHFILIAVTSKS